MHYFGVAKGILGRMQEQDLAKNQTLKLQINVDGLPLFKSSSQQFWPILALIEEDPIRSPFLIGLYCGYSKPTDASEYLSDFVAEMGKLASDGLEYQSKNIKIEISCFVCDAPAWGISKKHKSTQFLLRLRKVHARGLMGEPTPKLLRNRCGSQNR